MLRDQFVRIKADRSARTHARAKQRELLQDAGPERARWNRVCGAFRAARSGAEDALAMMEERPSSARVRAAFDAAAQSSVNFVVPRRYARVPLESPLRAQIDGAQAGMVRVKTISLGGASLESQKKLTVGDSIRWRFAPGCRDSLHGGGKKYRAGR